MMYESMHMGRPLAASNEHRYCRFQNFIVVKPLERKLAINWNG